MTIRGQIGSPEWINIRDVFETEDRDFTPWLNTNLGILSKALNLNLNDGNIEIGVGRFSCDIVAKEADTNSTVIIANQFGPTDHDHLGKVITYSAGKNASIIIWIAEEFREEHISALEWLNEKTSQQNGASFFAIEVKLIKTCESKIAPIFDTIVKPNDWERNMKR